MRDEVFAQLVRQHLGAVRAYARALTSDRHMADDAVQHTLTRAWRYIDSYDPRRPFQPWLIRICRNCIADLLVRNNREQRHREDMPEVDGSEVGGANWWVSGEGVVDLVDLVRRLPLAQREALVLVSVLGYSYEEAAALLHVPHGTVRSRFSRGRAALAEALQAVGHVGLDTQDMVWPTTAGPP
jgi:RNA polymerase sigma-70 factor, ECF subfamily